MCSVLDMTPVSVWHCLVFQTHSSILSQGPFETVGRVFDICFNVPVDSCLLSQMKLFCQFTVREILLLKLDILVKSI